MMVVDGAFSHKINYVPILEDNLILVGHLNSFIGSKVKPILVNGGFYIGVELHRFNHEGDCRTAPATLGLLKMK